MIWSQYIIIQFLLSDKESFTRVANLLKQLSKNPTIAKVLKNKNMFMVGVHHFTDNVNENK